MVGLWLSLWNLPNQFKEGRGFSTDASALEAEPPETFSDRLQKAIAALEEQVSTEALCWLGELEDLQGAP